MEAVAVREETFGALLRGWRQRRRVSQLDLGIEADVSARHISFLETGRARPSREMVMRLAEELGVPLRHRNRLLVAAGFAPVYPEREVRAPELGVVRQALDKILAGHEPYPAVVVDAAWNLVAANTAAAMFTEGVPAELLKEPVNVMRLSLHPAAMGGRLLNLAEVRAYLLSQLRRQSEVSGDERLEALYDELASYTYPGVDLNVGHVPGPADILVPLRIAAGDRVLSMFTTIATFGTPVDVTVSELAIETFWPSDEETAAAFARP
ncbi:helix-turn-helix domain-containing protein [Nonomuraea jiangxiensis]|uniref:Transcriptional regulator, contains XRE-family HTH domain n=1 Tax=Nonomuraea jiangxiensis TaxID=633440 RepID=A0A1G8K1T5_9ACTN|nr:helix-turn-helix transcriptional regulator [Nonomuraea jiangxiensis]SDI37378.1 Transcriptional regulator, contains XRE-family HTH domain [Nonomuraea jiangxiensis]